MRRSRGRVALAAVLLAAAGVLVYSGLQGALTYYRTPAEVVGEPADPDARLRLGGTVVPGSVRRDGTRTVFRLAGGGREITVRQRGAPPDTFREGQEAVVEGTLAPDGVFDSDLVAVRHGNEYRPATPGPSGASGPESGGY
jgi:cytochrome c-type biogenesis protein CcmE